METKLIRRVEDMPAAAAAVKLGGLVAVPTETVYGLCCDGLNAAAVERLYEAKGRPETKPLALMVPKAAAMRRYCRDIPAAAWLLAERYWPGPLTIVLPSRDIVPAIVRAGGDTVGLRCPRHPLTLALLEQSGLPLAGPSANPSGQPSPKSAEAVLAYFDGRIDAIVDGGECAVGTESTVFDMAHTPYRVLRQGAIPAGELEDALRENLSLIGITGGSGCGKTTLLSLLREKGALTLDCDEIYHRLTRESPALRAALEERFGAVYTPAGELDRAALGEAVFADPAALRDLNAVTHRFVTDEVERLLRGWAMNGGLLAAVDAIALFESGLADRCVFTVGVTADRERRMERIMARDGISPARARARIAAQPDAAFYEERCDYLLENNGSKEEFTDRCRLLLRQVL